jgi:hypothetical protein
MMMLSKPIHRAGLVDSLRDMDEHLTIMVLLRSGRLTAVLITLL